MHLFNMSWSMLQCDMHVDHGLYHSGMIALYSVLYANTRYSLLHALHIEETIHGSIITLFIIHNTPHNTIN